MRIPPLYRNSNWQRLFAGMAVGGCISWVIFLFMFGVMQERNSVIIKEQANKIHELQSDIKIWQDDYKELNEKNEEMLTIQKIKVELTNYEKYDITDSQSIYTIEEAIQEDLRPLLAKDLATVYKNKEMIEKTIENKVVKINGKKYEFVIREIHYYTTIHIEAELRLAD
ncbi:sporulation protein [Lederbergia sp. NSJ-179]|uniref:sporulation membrane protein YtrI n=1 Tax=Lederbergia sp. NSJ-179 TaxID=2931402 RepID=UPI001FD620D4|nr:sporulation membrane protein YtrI [Lederbergia sp. NSJ-179]MCJ7839739.1 sporulation protein [Lederbergia sp. NSJ-179]